MSDEAPPYTPGQEPDPRMIELWQRTDAVGFLHGLIEGTVPPSPHQEHAGARLTKVEAGRVEFDWVPPLRICNRAGIVHGGYLAVVLDDAAGIAAASPGERFVPMLTMDLKIEYLRPALPHQPHIVVGTIVHGGKTRTIADARIEDAQGRLVARASGSFTPNRAFLPERFAQ